MYLARHIIGHLAAAFPDRVDAATQSQIDRETDEVTDWRNEPATDRQIQYLASIDVEIEPNMTKGRASQLIDPPSEGQVRRLRFYAIPLPRYLTKDAASDLIDTYVRAHPETEEAYQAWKLQHGIA